MIPTRDRLAKTRRVIDEVRPQLIAGDEIIVVDDGSSDGTADALETEYGECLRVLRQTPRGAPSARNHGATAANSEWVIFLDSDDEVDPTWLGTFRKLSSDHPSAVVLFCGYVVRDARTGEMTSTRLPSPHALFPHVVCCWQHAGTYAVRKALFDAIGGFDKDFPAAQHYEFSLRAMTQLGQDPTSWAASSQTNLIYWANNADNIRGDRSRVGRAALLLLGRYPQLFCLPGAKVVAADNLTLGGAACARAGLWREACFLFRRAVRKDPGQARRWARSIAVCLPVFRNRLWQQDATTARFELKDLVIALRAVGRS
ncbi:MAG: glycosyltransferase family 2 protein [Motilibacteraceae bacterium]